MVEDKQGLLALVSSGSESPNQVPSVVGLGKFHFQFPPVETGSIFSLPVTSAAHRRCRGQLALGAGRASSLPQLTGPAALSSSFTGCLLPCEDL